MSDLDALLAGIVAEPHNHLRWLIVADWLDDHGQYDRAELLRLHRELIRTCCEVDRHPGRVGWKEQHARIIELIDQGVKPCVPQHTLMLPGGVPFVGNFIPPGSFLMGSEEREEEKPIRKVTLTTGFFLGVHPVTQDQWMAVMGSNPSDYPGADRPVENANWPDATRFCQLVAAHTRERVHLPSEAQWEYACRAGTTTHFSFGTTDPVSRMVHGLGPRVVEIDPASEPPAETLSEPEGKTSPVGTKPANAWGLFDCHGNVWEWCADHYVRNAYGHSPRSDPVVERARVVTRSLRGGAWNSETWQCRSANRWRLNADGRYWFVGFRVVFTLS
jgi:uncharacterized protein (TIGR02996 family)